MINFFLVITLKKLLLLAVKKKSTQYLGLISSKFTQKERETTVKLIDMSVIYWRKPTW